MLGGLEFRTIAVAVKRALQSVVGTIGTNGSALVADSSQPNGARWAPKAIAPGGRVTLATGDAVPSSDQTGKTTVYYTPYAHDIIELFDGTGWQPYQFAEMSQATSDTTKSPAAVANNSNYDIFVWNDSGTLRATRGPLWTSDTARGTGAGTTELELFEGRYVNKVAITNGPAARRGVYVGTIRSDGSAQINDSALKRHVWNAFNRELRYCRVTDTANSWTYGATSYRQVNANTANQIDILVGLQIEPIRAHATHLATCSSANEPGGTGVGVNSTTVNAAQRQVPGFTSHSTAGQLTTHHAIYEGYPTLGRFYFVWLEISSGTGTHNFYGDNSGGGYLQTGMSAEVFA